MRNYTQSFKIIFFGLILAVGISYVFAAPWVGPTGTPPTNNIEMPLTVGASTQTKLGTLQVNGFRNIGDSVFDGNVGIGTASPTEMLDVVGIVRSDNSLKVYVGATSGSYNGLQIGGYDGGDAKCVATFGAGARMAYAGDFINVRPTLNGWYNTFTSATGDCSGWTSDFNYGQKWHASDDHPSGKTCSASERILCVQ